MLIAGLAAGAWSLESRGSGVVLGQFGSQLGPALIERPALCPIVGVQSEGVAHLGIQGVQPAQHFGDVRWERIPPPVNQITYRMVSWSAHSAHTLYVQVQVQCKVQVQVSVLTIDTKAGPPGLLGINRSRVLDA